MGNATQIVAGTLSLDKFGERLFLVVRPGMHVRFGERVITGGEVIRVLGGRTNFENELLANESQAVSIAARIATPQELEGLASSQVTDPTLIAETIVRFVDVQRRAFEIFLTDEGPAESNWLRAERALLAT